MAMYEYWQPIISVTRDETNNKILYLTPKYSIREGSPKIALKHVKNEIANALGVPLENIDDFLIVNNSEASAIPNLIGAETNKTGNKVILHFDQVIQHYEYLRAMHKEALKVTVNSINRVITDVAFNPQDYTTLILTLESNIQTGQIVKTSYVKGSIYSEVSGVLQNYSDRDVTNLVV